MQPPFLKPGNTIGITCPSGYVSYERVAYAVTLLQKHGYQVVLGNTVGIGDHYFAGTDAERAADLQAMLDNPSIHAILMGRGGYGVTRIIDRLDFTQFLQSPKWLCGFSDITVLHSHVQACHGVASLHSPMCGHFKPETEHTLFLHSFYHALAGLPLVYQAPATQFNRHGTAQGVLTGGNLAILAHLTGSVSEVDMHGKLLFIEDVGEHLYNLDRMLMNLKRAGKLQHLSGLIAGGFTDLQDTERPFGQTVYQLIWDKVAEYDYPVCFDFPCGHQDINYTLTLGAPHRLTVDEHGSKLEKL